MSDTDTGTPIDAGALSTMDATNAVNPPEATTSDVPNQIPAPEAPPQTAPDPGFQEAPTPTAPAPPHQPGIWKSVLFGALQGLAAGGSVNTRGMGKGAGFAAGAAAGLNQVLNVQPQQKIDQDQTKASTALHYANLAKIQQDMNLMPDSRREQHLDDAVDHTEQLFKSGAIVPMSEVSKDPIDAQKKLMALHAQNPWAVYSIAPVRDENGDVAYQTVQFGKAPLQKDLVLPGMGADGKDLTIPAGTPGETVGKLYTAAFTKQMDAAAKKDVASTNQKSRMAVQGLKNQGALEVQNLKNQSATDRAGSKAPDMAVGTTDDGQQVSGSPAELAAAGIKNPTKLPGIEGAKVTVARQLIDPNKGLVTKISDTIDDLDKQGKLGVVASRWGAFLSGKVGDDPDFQRLGTLFGIFHTAVMQAHVGARGSAEMMEHFKNLANPDISSPGQIRAGLQALKEYLTEKAMIIPGSPLDRAIRAKSSQSAPAAQATPAAASAPAPMKGIQKSTGKPVVSNDGGKTWQLAQ